MEEDIKKIEEFIEGIEECGLNDCGKKHLDFNLLRNLLKAYKELEELKKQVTEIENTNFIKYKNYIPVSLVEEKIEELNKKINDIPDNEGNFAKAILIRTKITLQELLEKRK